MQQYVVKDTILDHWRDGCWHFLAFPAKDDGASATAVMAVKLPPGRVQVRGAIVPDDTSLPVKELAGTSGDGVG